MFGLQPVEVLVAHLGARLGAAHEEHHGEYVELGGDHVGQVHDRHSSEAATPLTCSAA
jgi:hypothetical protein